MSSSNNLSSNFHYVHVCSQWFNDSKETLLFRIDIIVASCSCYWPAIEIPVSPYSAALEAWHSKVFNANLFPSRNRACVIMNCGMNIRLFFTVCKFMKNILFSLLVQSYLIASYHIRLAHTFFTFLATNAFYIKNSSFYIEIEFVFLLCK